MVSVDCASGLSVQCQTVAAPNTPKVLQDGKDMAPRNGRYSVSDTPGGSGLEMDLGAGWLVVRMVLYLLWRLDRYCALLFRYSKSCTEKPRRRAWSALKQPSWRLAPAPAKTPPQTSNPLCFSLSFDDSGLSKGYTMDSAT